MLVSFLSGDHIIIHSDCRGCLGQGGGGRHGNEGIYIENEMCELTTACSCFKVAILEVE